MTTNATEDSAALTRAAAVTGPVVRVLGRPEAERGIAPILMAFAVDPVARWFYPEPHQYWTFAPRLVKAFAGRAFEHGTAFGVEGYFASALWLPPGVTTDEEAMGAVVEESISPADLEGKGVFRSSRPPFIRMSCIGTCR